MAQISSTKVYEFWLGERSAHCFQNRILDSVNHVIYPPNDLIWKMT